MAEEPRIKVLFHLRHPVQALYPKGADSYEYVMLRRSTVEVMEQRILLDHIGQTEHNFYQWMACVIMPGEGDALASVPKTREEFNAELRKRCEAWMQNHSTAGSWYCPGGVTDTINTAMHYLEREPVRAVWHFDLPLPDEPVPKSGSIKKG